MRSMTFRQVDQSSIGFMVLQAGRLMATAAREGDSKRVCRIARAIVCGEQAQDRKASRSRVEFAWRVLTDLLTEECAI